MPLWKDDYSLQDLYFPLIKCPRPTTIYLETESIKVCHFLFFFFFVGAYGSQDEMLIEKTGKLNKHYRNFNDFLKLCFVAE